MLQNIAIVYICICLVSTIILLFDNSDKSLRNSTKQLYKESWEESNIILSYFEIFIFTIFLCLLFFITPFALVVRVKDKTLGKSETLKETKEEEIEEKPRYQFRMRHDDMFRPDVNQVFYIETSFNPEINDFFERNLDEIKEIFLTEYNKEWCERGLDFIYLPRAIQDLDVAEFFAYNRPDLNGVVDFSKEEILNFIQNEYVKGLYGNHWSSLHPIMNQPVEHYAEGINITQGFIHYKRTEFNKFINRTEDQYSYFPLYYENDEQFFALIREYASNTGTIEAFYSNRKTCQDVPPEYDEEVQEITKEIKERIERLQCIGLNNMIINKLILPEVKLSKLRITKDYKIFLVDYNNTEIEMPTLSKTLFFFYLRHTAGIPFKLLSDYKDELFQIYKRVTNRDDIEALKTSIEYLVSPLNNSINEKCSRIRAAFIKEIDENVAQNYYITAQDTALALVRRITLDRNLVIDEAGII